MALRSRFTALDRNINRIAAWGTFVGLVWVAMSWVASNIAPLAGYGWGAFVFVGLGAASVLSLVMSMALIAWRYFNPLPTQSEIVATSPAKDGAGTELLEIQRDLLHLLDFAVAQTTVAFMDELYQLAPSFGDPLKMEEGFLRHDDDGRKYLRRAQSDLGDSHYGAEIRLLMQESQTDAEIMVKGMPAEQRPEGVDPLDFREHAITALQCGRARVFFWQQKREIEAQLRNQRSKLIERRRQRSSSK